MVMIEIEEINKLKSKYDDCCKKYKDKSDELQKLSSSQNGAINDELTICEKVKKDIYEQLCVSQSKYRDACNSYVNNKLASMEEIEREIFHKEHDDNMRKDNWDPVLNALSKILLSRQNRLI